MIVTLFGRGRHRRNLGLTYLKGGGGPGSRRAGARAGAPDLEEFELEEWLSRARRDCRARFNKFAAAQIFNHSNQSFDQQQKTSTTNINSERPIIMVRLVLGVIVAIITSIDPESLSPTSERRRESSGSPLLPYAYARIHMVLELRKLRYRYSHVAQGCSLACSLSPL